MARRKSPGDAPALPLTGGTRAKVGAVERAAYADVRALRELNMLGPGTDALVAAYRKAGRLLDRADDAGKPWDAFAAIRELRATRVELAPTVATLEADDMDRILEELAALIREDRDAS